MYTIGRLLYMNLNPAKLLPKCIVKVVVYMCITTNNPDQKQVLHRILFIIFKNTRPSECKYAITHFSVLWILGENKLPKTCTDRPDIKCAHAQKPSIPNI